MVYWLDYNAGKSGYKSFTEACSHCPYTITTPLVFCFPCPTCSTASKEKYHFQLMFHDNVVNFPPTVSSPRDGQSYLRAVSLVSVQRMAPALIQCKYKVLSMKTVFVNAFNQPSNSQIHSGKDSIRCMVIFQSGEGNGQLKEHSFWKL